MMLSGPGLGPRTVRLLLRLVMLCAIGSGIWILAGLFDNDGPRAEAHEGVQPSAPQAASLRPGRAHKPKKPKHARVDDEPADTGPVKPEPPSPATTPTATGTPAAVLPARPQTVSAMKQQPRLTRRVRPAERRCGPLLGLLAMGVMAGAPTVLSGVLGMPFLRMQPRRPQPGADVLQLPVRRLVGRAVQRGPPPPRRPAQNTDHRRSEVTGERNWANDDG
jgi:hypothetical protein